MDPLVQYLTSLRSARTTYSKDERKGADDAIIATCDYLRAIGAEIDLRAPLIALTAGLGDLDRGVVPPILRPSERRRQRQSIKPTMEALNLAAAACAVTIALDAGDKNSEAIKNVAVATGLPKNKIANVLRNIDRKNTAPAMVAEYNWFVATARGYTDQTPRERADNALALARKMIGKR